MTWQELTERIQEAAKSAFGEAVIYKPASGGLFEVTGIWSSSHYASNLEGEGVVSSRTPTIGVQLSELAALGIDPKSDDEVEARGANYRVDNVEPDGEGAVTLFIKRTA